jgi:hypothetical protein
MARFSEVLAQNPAPAALGDIALRYEPSMLIGETPKLERSLRPTIAWLLGISLLLAAFAQLVLLTDSLGVAVLGALAIAAATRLERFEKRQRRFVANFTTTTLRLDFASAIVGYPQTLNVDFDDVQAVEVLPQADGALCLVVDFRYRGRLLREVLTAYVPEDKRDELERLHRLLEGAFGLGDVPADSPALVAVNEESSFEP